MQQNTEKDSPCSGEKDGESGPFYGAGLSFYGKDRGGAGPVEEGEKDHGERRLPGPSMAYQHIL